MIFLYLIFNLIIKIRDLVYIRIRYFYISFFIPFLYLILLKYEMSFTLEYDIFISLILKIRGLICIRI